MSFGSFGKLGALFGKLGVATSSSAPPWVLHGAALDLDFVNGRYYGTTSVTSTLSLSRASTAYAQTAAGALTSFSSNVLRITDLGLLIEEARTNLCLRSQELGNAAWTANNSSITSNALAAPDGTTTAERLHENSSNAQHYVSQSITITTAAYTWSVYAKNAGRGWLVIDANDGSAHLTFFDLSAAGAVGTNAAGNTATINALANGWYRCSVSRTAGGTGGVINLFSAPLDATDSYTGDGASGVYLWGAQLEAGAFPTSYAPTIATSVTRAADVITATTSALKYSGVAYSVYSSVLFSQTDVKDAYLLDADSGERILMIMGKSATAPKMQYGLQHSASYSVLANGSTNLGSGRNISAKVMTAFQTSDFVAYANGTSDLTSGAAVMPAPATFYIGQDFGGSNPLNGYLKRLTIWNSRVSNVSAQAFTA